MDINHVLVICLSIGISYCQRQPPASVPANNAGSSPASAGKAAGPGPGAANNSPKIQGKPGDIRPYRSMIVKLHNDYRRSEGATSMKLLRWSRKLEREAYNHVNKCRYTHQYGSWGENLYKVESFLPDNVLIERALSTWYYEKLSWHWQGDCSEACHYTQMVWSTTAEVGCAFKKCPVLHLREEFLNNAWMLVCFYNPQGNVIGEFPYIHGRPCSECAREDYCDRGLCSSPAPVYRPQPPPPKPRTRPPPAAPTEPRNPPPTRPPPPRAEAKRQPPPLAPKPAEVRRDSPPPVVHSASTQKKKPPVFKANIPPVDKKYDAPKRPRPAAQDQYAPSPPPRQQPAARNPPPQRPKSDPYQPPPAPTDPYQPQPKQQQSQYQPPPPPKEQPAPHKQQPVHYQHPQPSEKPAQQSSVVSQPLSARDQNLGVQSSGQEKILDIVANANGVFTTGELRPANNNPHPSLLGRNKDRNIQSQKNGANKSFGVNLGGPKQGLLSSLPQTHSSHHTHSHDPQLAQPPPPRKRVPPTPPPRPPTTTTLPPPPSQPNCPDNDKHCPSWKVYCDTNPYVHENCRFTCNTCNVPTPPRVFGPPETNKAAPLATSAPVRRTTTRPAPTQPIVTTIYPPTYAPSTPPSQPSQPGRRRPPPAQRRRKPPPRQRPYTQATQPPHYAHTQTPAYGPATQPPYQRTPAYNGFARNPPTTTPYYSASGIGGAYQGPAAAYNTGPSIPSGVGGGPNFICKDYDRRCNTWSRYCGLDEYVDDMCRKTCHRCFA